MKRLQLKQTWVSIGIYGTQRIRPIHTTPENSTQLQMHCLFKKKNWAIILWLLEVQRDEEKNSLLAQSPATDSVVQSTAWSLTPSQVICLHPSFKDN